MLDPAVDAKGTRMRGKVCGKRSFTEMTPYIKNDNVLFSVSDPRIQILLFEDPFRLFFISPFGSIVNISQFYFIEISL